MIAIKQMGTNGAIFWLQTLLFRFENPNYFTNILKNFNPSYTYCFNFSLDLYEKKKLSYIILV